MCTYTEIDKNGNKINAILKNDHFDKKFVKIRNEHDNTRKQSLTKSLEPNTSFISDSTKKMKDRIIYTKSLSIIKPNATLNQKYRTNNTENSFQRSENITILNPTKNVV